MKVWNEDIEDCSDCPFQGVGGMDTPICNITYKDIKSSEIHPECPFNKPITKEVIEGFGFKFVHKNIDFETYEGHFPKTLHTNIKEDRWYIRFESSDHRFLITQGVTSATRFFGTITSKPHLEFILTSLNIL